MATYYTACRLHLGIMVLDVKLGFAEPEEALLVVERVFPEAYEYWYQRFYRAAESRAKSAGKGANKR